jgi:hypothetical protein
MVNAVVEQAKSYRSAIRKSLKTANDGVSLADDAITLCDILLNAQDSSNDIALFVNSMIDTAITAHHRAKATSTQFRNIRSGLLQVWMPPFDTIPTSHPTFADSSVRRCQT